MSEIAISGGFTHKDQSVGFRLGMYLFREDGRYIVYCPALDMSACGETETEAKSSFAETLRMSLSYMLDKNTLKKDLNEHGWEIKSLKERTIKAPSFERMYANNECLREIINSEDYTTYKEDVYLPLTA